jgi:hypothetical protein
VWWRLDRDGWACGRVSRGVGEGARGGSGTREGGGFVVVYGVFYAVKVRGGATVRYWRWTWRCEFGRRCHLCGLAGWQVEIGDT